MIVLVTVLVGMLVIPVYEEDETVTARLHETRDPLHPSPALEPLFRPDRTRGEDPLQNGKRGTGQCNRLVCTLGLLPEL